MADMVLSRLRGGIHYETDYNSDLDRNSAKGIADFVTNVELGSIVLANYTATLALKCPDTKIAMLGYSLGSFVQSE